MLFTKYQRKSDRVKSISFHPTRPLLLSALHSGVIELIDYRIKQRISTYEDHEGAVRAVQFHPHLSLFCSGGDDFIVRVYNYKKCQFMLQGHLDYVRCVSFHSTQPWVLSGSDDQTARVWNYQSRQTIAILTGHTHYIMSCHFHPTQDLIITCSLDNTARLWNFGVLKQRFAQRKNQEYVLSGAEVSLVSILDAHKDQLNWCAFHATQPFILTAADDKTIKIWKYTETKCWEFDTLKGHTDNVCCAAFHQKEDVIISDSEDHSVRVWDFSKRQEIAYFENKDFDRYWTISTHPDNYYFACGSDSALQVFALHKDRVPLCLVNDRYLVLAQKKLVKVTELLSAQTQVIQDISNQVSQNLLEDNIEDVEYNSYDSSKTQLMIRCIQTKGIRKHFLLVFQPNKNDQSMKQFTAKNACFVSKNKIVRINYNLELYNYETDNVVSISEDKYERVFPYPGGKILAYIDKQLHLIDPFTKQIIAQTDSAVIKHIVFGDNYFAAFSKTTIQIFNKQLNKIIEVHEPINIKSIIWMDQYMIYTTKSQLKYLLLNGDSGILKSTEHILFLAKVEKVKDINQLKITGVDTQLQQFLVDISEINFKIAVKNKDIESIRKFVENNQNEAVISYLYEKRLAHVALKLIKDQKARFSLSLDSCILEQAYKIATELQDQNLYEQLRIEAINQGNLMLADVCDQQLNKLDRLSFLYVVQGNTEKLQKLNKLNPSFINSLYIGDIQEKLNLIKTIPKLHELSAYIHGYNVQLDQNQKESLNWLEGKCEALVPLVPIDKQQKHEPWPLVEIRADIKQDEDEEFFEIEEPMDGWEIKNDEEDEAQAAQQQQSNTQQATDSPISKKTQKLDKSINKNLLLENGEIKGDVAWKYFLAGHFDQGLNLLKAQINLINKEQLLKLLKQQSNNETILSQIPFISHIVYPISSNRILEIQQLIKQGQKFTTDAKFGEVTNSFQQVLQQILISQYQDQFANYINLATNYLMAMRCDQLKQSGQVEMACKMATFKLSPQHRILTLRQALNVTYKNKQFITCQWIAKKLIELLTSDSSTKPEVLANAQKVEKQAIQVNTNTQQVEFQQNWLEDDSEPHFSAQSMKLLTQFITCPYDGSCYETTYNGICIICGLCQVGDAQGWRH